MSDAPLFLESPDRARRFGSVVRVYGQAATQSLAQSHVLVAGIGGVGSWAAEALARSGIGQITLVDMDHVAESNINRQVHALDSTLGQAKVSAMRNRIALINPDCCVIESDVFVETGNVQDTISPGADVVLDCTDQLNAKLAMVLCCRQREQALVVCGAAGGKTDALTLKLGDLRDATHDALLARLRTTLRKQHGFAPARLKRPAKLGVDVLWFSEPTKRPPTFNAQDAAQSPLACAGYGSLVTVTAAMGFAAAARAIDVLVKSSTV